MKLESIIDARAKHVHSKHRLAISEERARKVVYKQISKLGAVEDVCADLNAGEEFQIFNPEYPELPIQFLVGKKFTLINSYLYVGGDGYLTVFPSDAAVALAPAPVGPEYVVRDSQNKTVGRFYGNEVYLTLVNRLGMQGDNVRTNRLTLNRMFQTAYRLVCKAAVSAAEAEGLVSDKKREEPGYPPLWLVESCTKKMVERHPECRDTQEGLLALSAAMSIVNSVENWHPEAIKRTSAFIAEMCAEEPKLSDGAMLIRYINQEKPAKESCIQKINAIPRECIDAMDLQIRSNAQDLKMG